MSQKLSRIIDRMNSQALRKTAGLFGGGDADKIYSESPEQRKQMARYKDFMSGKEAQLLQSQIDAMGKKFQSQGGLTDSDWRAYENAHKDMGTLYNGFQRRQKLKDFFWGGGLLGKFGRWNADQLKAGARQLGRWGRIGSDWLSGANATSSIVAQPKGPQQDWAGRWHDPNQKGNI